MTGKLKQPLTFISPESTIYADITNLKDFCITHQLDYQRMHKVVTNRLKHYHGWMMYQDIDTLYSFMSPDKTVYQNITNLKDFCSIHKLNYASMLQVEKGIVKSYQGWMKAFKHCPHCKQQENNSSAEKVKDSVSLESIRASIAALNSHRLKAYQHYESILFGPDRFTKLDELNSKVKEIESTIYGYYLVWNDGYDTYCLVPSYKDPTPLTEEERQSSSDVAVRHAISHEKNQQMRRQ